MGSHRSVICVHSFDPTVSYRPCWLGGAPIPSALQGRNLADPEEAGRGARQPEPASITSGRHLPALLAKVVHNLWPAAKYPGMGREV